MLGNIPIKHVLWWVLYGTKKKYLKKNTSMHRRSTHKKTKKILEKGLKI